MKAVTVIITVAAAPPASTPGLPSGRQRRVNDNGAGPTVRATTPHRPARSSGRSSRRAANAVAHIGLVSS
ncbi:hypothetical protein HBB16_08365 [Pseudonocardia sp. MCCB 268]|nr:hypothetical protein [Pseudonocardia cytotoxica]